MAWHTAYLGRVKPDAFPTLQVFTGTAPKKADRSEDELRARFTALEARSNVIPIRRNLDQGASPAPEPAPAEPPGPT